MLTTSPVAMPSPSSGRALSAIIASPVVDADADVQAEGRVGCVQLGERVAGG